MVIALACGIGFSIIGNLWVEHYYEIEEPISIKLFNSRFENILVDVENIYHIDGAAKRNKEIIRIKTLLIKDPLILELYQQDKGASYKYGVDYLGYTKEEYMHSYFYKNGSLRNVGDLIRGYVETSDGNKTDAISITRKVKINDKDHDIKLIVDYQMFYNEALNSAL